MDVVVQDSIAVLEVLPLGDAVGGDKEINLGGQRRSSPRLRAAGAKLVRMELKSLRP